MKSTHSKVINNIKGENMEIRILSDNYIEIKGRINYNSRSELIFSKDKKEYFIEQIKPNAFKKCLDKQGIPALIFNHDWGKKNKIVSFDYEDIGQKYFMFRYVIECSEYLLRNTNNITSFSFAFLCEDDEWTRLNNNKAKWLRTINSFRYINEFSLLIGKDPCYTSAKIFFDDEKIDKEQSDKILLDLKKFIETDRQKKLHEFKNYIQTKKSIGMTC